MTPPIVVVSTAANCPEAARKCVASVDGEKARHYFAAADPATFDATLGLIGRRVLRPASQIANLIALITPLDPATIVIHLDGDDELTPGAIERVAREYESPDVWLTYGSFVRSDGVRDRDWAPYFGHRYEPFGFGPRNQSWRASHLRTFRAGLFHRIPLNYVHDPITKQPFSHCVDRAVMLPMIEMADERYSVIQDVLCVYNHDHDRSMTAEERAAEAHDRETVHAMRPLEPLTVRPW